VADPNTLNPDTLTAIQTEITRIAGLYGTLEGQVKGFKDSLARDVGEARSHLEAKMGGSYDTQQRALEAVEQKHVALERLVSQLGESQSSIRVALERVGAAGGTGEPSAERKQQVADAVQFKTTQLVRSGRLEQGRIIRPEDCSVEELVAYQEKAFPTFVRRGEQQMGQLPGYAEEYKALSVASDSDGGYLVPPAMDRNVRSKIFETTPMRELAGNMAIGTDALEYPISDGEFGFGWVGETEARPETTTSQISVARIPVHEMYAMPAATQKLLEDASINVDGWITDQLADRFGRAEATAFVSGNGIKRPRGFLDYPNTPPVAGSVRGWIETFNSGDANNITPDALVTMPFQFKEQYQGNLTWLFKRQTLAKIALLRETTTGHYLWTPGLRDRAASVLVGYPFRTADDMPALAANANAGALGDWRRGYMIVDRMGMVMQRDPFTKKPFVLYYTRRRVGGDVIDFEAIKLLKIAV
jgi:HK97 family phage major capsid protein